MTIGRGGWWRKPPLKNLAWAIPASISSTASTSGLVPAVRPKPGRRASPVAIIDDATRYNTGARLYPAETLLAHLDFLPRTFQAHGLPLE